MYQELRLDLILNTLRTLESRIAERFPGSGLSRVAGELTGAGEAMGPLLDRLRRPNMYLRAGVGLLILLIVALPLALLFYLPSLSADVDGVGSSTRRRWYRAGDRRRYAARAGVINWNL